MNGRIFIKLTMLLLLIGKMTYLRKGPLVVMLICHFALGDPLTISLI